MPTKKKTTVLGAEELQLLASLSAIADAIVAQSLSLEASDAQDYIESELAKTAVRMKRYENKGAVGAASVGFAINVCLRERIKARLAEWQPLDVRCAASPGSLRADIRNGSDSKPTSDSRKQT